MPWCAACDRFLSPSTVRSDGSCPTCGRRVDVRRAGASNATSPTTEQPPVPVPWHLKLLLAALAVYLAYRAFQGVAWVITHV